MVAFTQVALLAAVFSATLASPGAPTYTYSRFGSSNAQIPSQWAPQGPAPKGNMIRAQIGLKQQNIEKLEAKLLDISHPDSTNYGKWLSKSEIDAITAPREEDIKAVKTWLHAYGITEIDSKSPDWLEFTVPVSKMEQLLNTKYTTYKHIKNGRSIPRTHQYELPQELHGLIDMVTPTTAFYSRLSSTESKHDTMAQESVLKRPTSCDTSKLTPSCLRKLYNVDYTSKGNSTVGTTEMAYQAALPSDFALFTKHYAPGTPNYTEISINGGFDMSNGDNFGEGNLDTQWAAALASPNPSTFIDVGPENVFSDEIANFASWLTSGADVPSVVSTSYGDFEIRYQTDYITRICNEFMKAGAAGISVLFASGDAGIGDYYNDSCDGGFIVVWPASCPWITSVGGTQFNSDGTESVAIYDISEGINGSSGGGFSNKFPIPSYQMADVTQYLQELTDIKFQGTYNRSGRGYPDVSLVGQNYLVYDNGNPVTAGGTSASAPAWAGLISTLNDYRKSKGKATLGFLNTLLYSKTGRAALRDVTQGNNQGCQRDGFPALKGWDPASGLGTLDFGKLRALL